MGFQASFDKIIEGTFVAVLVFLVVANPNGFSTAIAAAGKVYVDAVRQLQGGGIVEANNGSRSSGGGSDSSQGSLR